MNFQTVEETIRADYREVSPRYRQDDEIEVTTGHHRRISRVLRDICEGFDRPIRALDVGCGTGRYFHALTNVAQLTGLDVTEEMLRAAKHPVCRETIVIPDIRLVCGNAYLMEFPPESFDFIYSLGMFGNGCPVNVDICDRFHRWLAPGGRLFFNTIDVGGLPWWYRARRRVRSGIYPLLPRGLRESLDNRQAHRPFCALSKTELKRILQASSFNDFEIHSHLCESPLWEGRHLECLATKD